MNEQPKMDMTETPIQDLDSSETIVFYNVQNLFDMDDDPLTNDEDFTHNGAMRWDQSRYDDKLEQLSKVLYAISNQAPLLIGMVEVENKKVILELANKGNLATVSYKAVHFDSDDNRGIDCALLYNSAKIASIHQEKLSVYLANHPDFNTRDILYFKGITNDDETIHILVNHWSSRREGQLETEEKRLAAAAVLVKKVKDIQAENQQAKVIIMGDFNDEPNNKSVQKVLDVKNMDGTAFLSNLMQPIKDKGLGTLVHHREWLLFDQFIVSNQLLSTTKLHIKEKIAHIYNNDQLLYHFPNGSSKPNATYGGTQYYGGISDHLPIYLILSK